MNIEHISVSRFGTFEECAQKYKYRYHLKIKSNKPEPFYFSYGKLVHKIAEEYVNNKGKKVITEIASDVLGGKIEIDPGVYAPKLPADYKKKFPDHIRAIKKLVDQIGFDGQTEYQFKYDLDPPHGKHVTGFIDWLIIREDQAWIIDYKTTKKGPFRKNRFNITSDLQLKCYCRVVQRNFGIAPEKIKAALYYLEGGELVGATFTEDSLKQAEQILLNAYNQIEATEPSKVTGLVGDHCRRCDYSDICPFYQGTY